MALKINRRPLLALGASLALGVWAMDRLPFPEEHPLLQLILIEKPILFAAIKYGYLSMLLSTPYILVSVIISIFYIFAPQTENATGLAKLPPYPEPAGRKDLFVVLGELHHAKRPEPAPDPRWLVLPARGLFTGISVFGAIGSGKTSGCMYPFAEQILAYRANDPEHRIGGLVLEVKGDFCHKVRTLLTQNGRAADYLEISLNTSYRYNPLHNDLDAYALAYGIASLLNNLFGRGKEPFWQQAYTNLVKFVILLHKVVDGYVTLFDVYDGVINPDRLEELIRRGEERFRSDSLLIDPEAFMAHPELTDEPFDVDPGLKRMRAPLTEARRSLLESLNVSFEVESRPGQGAGAGPDLDTLREQFEAVKRWFFHDWLRIEAKLRTSIVEGISVFLSLFDDNPAMKRVFCPPKETYDPVANKDGRYGIPVPSFSELIERGTVCTLNFPASANPGLARVIGTLMKQDFQRAVLSRIPQLESDRIERPAKHWREVLFLCDEYQAFATVGESDPSGDEKFFALSRQAKCIPIVATQSISSLRSTLPGETWRTLLQTFRTKIFLSLSDDFSARTASELCGKEEQLKLNYNFSEHGQDAGVSVFTGTATAHRSTIGASKGYSVQRDFTFEPKSFTELKNCQAIVLAYDGLNPWPPTYCYLKPYYLDPNRSYFEHLREGKI